MWPRFVNTAVGIWLMAAPAVLGYGDPAQTNDRIAGPIAVTFAFIAIWEATRGVRWVNFPLGLWMVAAPWVLGYGATVPTLNSVVAGIILAGLSILGGEVKQRFGGGWSVLWRSREPA